MVNYDDIPEGYKEMYSKEQLDQIIEVVNQISIWFASFKEALDRLFQLLQPKSQSISELYRELDVISISKENKVLKYSHNIKPKYKPYKPKIKKFNLYRRTIYYHIRSNC